MTHLRVLRPAPGVLAFYDGRVDGYRFAAGSNWVDDGALSLGIASYAVVEGDEAIVYDTHVSAAHARQVRDALEELGVRRFTVVLSHWHLDHVAGTAAFADCEVLASERTAEILAGSRAAIESGTLEGPPGIDPLILPTSTFSGRRRIALGATEIELIHTHIHSDDATVLWLPNRRILLCGDTLEDTVTYVDEPQHFDVHLANLERLRELGAERILPNHGDPGVIASGGYTSDLIDATEQYIRALQRCRTEPGESERGLAEFLAHHVASGSPRYYAGYEAVHRHNVAVTLGTA